MKYILIIIAYVMMGFYHLIDIIIRTLVNAIIFLWDFKIKGKTFYSYKQVAFKEGNEWIQISVIKHYSQLKELY